MSKVRVYELARELGMEDSKPLMRILRDMGYKVKTASSGLEAEAVRKIREVVAPHIEQARREAEDKAKKKEAKSKKKAKAAAPAAKVKVRRVVRVVNRPSEAQKQALMDRHERILAGETPVRSAAEAMENAEEQKRAADEAARVLAEEKAKAEAEAKAIEDAKAAAIAEAAAAEAEAREAVSQIRPEPVSPKEEVAPKSESKPAPVAKSRPQETQKGRALPPDQAIAQAYRSPRPPAPRGPGGNGFSPSQNRPPAGGGNRGSGGRGPSSGDAKKGGGPNKRPASRTREIAQVHRGPRRPNFHHRMGSGRKRRGRRKRTNEVKVDMTRQIEVPEIISLGDLAGRMEVPASDVIKYMLKQGKMMTKNQGLDYDQASAIVLAYGLKVKEAGDDEDIDLDLLEDDEDLGDENRPPIVTVLGHVDHGKTSLLDAIRQTDVTAGEAGGITQSIGAYNVPFGDRSVTFIDTPGHEAFTQMRARGAQVTDVAILVVAADDGVMPQTIEAINHVKAAKVPIIVAMNKIDRPDANPDKLMQQLAEHNIVVEAWGGETPCVQVSALQKTGIEELLEMITLVSEMQELKADSTRDGTGIIVEAGLDKGLGAVATVLVQNGTLNRGDTVVVGDAYGRIRALISDNGKKVKQAGPSIPVSIVGLSNVPSAGDILTVVADEKMARQVSEARTDKSRKERIKGPGRATLEDLFASVQKGEQEELRLLIKTDTQGSAEALAASLLKLSTDEVKVDIVHSAVGAITESDVMLASASDAIVIGFAVRPSSSVAKVAEQENVELRLYKVIYHCIEEVEKAMTGLLAPEIRVEELGKAEVREVFKISKTGQVAGCYVVEGKVTRDAQIRVVRDGILVFEGKLAGLRRFKDDVKEVAEGYECGITVANYNDIQAKDIIEAFREESIARESLSK